MKSANLCYYIGTERKQGKQPTNRKALTMTTKYTFFVGLADKEAKVQVIATIDAERIVERVFAKHGVDGATITGARGIYVHESGEVVTEETICVQVFEFGASVPVQDICNDLKSLLNQESIAVERKETDSALY